MSRIELTPEERESRALTPERLALAVQSVKVDGYVLFPGVLPPALTQARTRYCRRAARWGRPIVRRSFPRRLDSRRLRPRS